METEDHIFTGWEITSLREQQLSRVDDTVVDAGLFIGTLDESPEYRLELLIMLLQGVNLAVDDTPVALSSEDKEILLSTPLAHSYAIDAIVKNKRLSELFPDYNVQDMDRWLEPSSGGVDDPYFWQSEARVFLHNLVVASYAKTHLAQPSSDFPQTQVQCA